MEKIGRVKRLYSSEKGLYFVFNGKRVYLDVCDGNVVFATNNMGITFEWAKTPSGDYGIQLYGCTN